MSNCAKCGHPDEFHPVRSMGEDYCYGENDTCECDTTKVEVILLDKIYVLRSALLRAKLMLGPHSLQSDVEGYLMIDVALEETRQDVEG